MMNVNNCSFEEEVPSKNKPINIISITISLKLSPRNVVAFIQRKLGLSKPDYLWTNCIFSGNPPAGYDAWSDWVAKSHETGLFTGVEIKTIDSA